MFNDLDASSDNAFWILESLGDQASLYGRRHLLCIMRQIKCLKVVVILCISTGIVCKTFGTNSFTTQPL